MSLSGRLRTLLIMRVHGDLGGSRHLSVNAIEQIVGSGNHENTFSIVLLIILVAASAVAQSNKSAQKVERELIELERQLSEALARQDAPVLDRLWSESLVFTFRMPDFQQSQTAGGAKALGRSHIRHVTRRP